MKSILMSETIVTRLAGRIAYFALGFVACFYLFSKGIL